MPLFVADVEKNEETGELVFTPFDFKELSPEHFPDSPHARGHDAQSAINSMRYPNPTITILST